MRTLPTIAAALALSAATVAGGCSSGSTTLSQPEQIRTEPGSTRLERTRAVVGRVPTAAGRVERVGAKPLRPAELRYYLRQYAKVRLRGDGLDAVAALGHANEIHHYGVGSGSLTCDIFDGGFVLCLDGGRVVGKALVPAQ